MYVYKTLLWVLFVTEYSRCTIYLICFYSQLHIKYVFKSIQVNIDSYIVYTILYNTYKYKLHLFRYKRDINKTLNYLILLYIHMLDIRCTYILYSYKQNNDKKKLTKALYTCYIYTAIYTSYTYIYTKFYTSIYHKLYSCIYKIKLRNFKLTPYMVYTCYTTIYINYIAIYICIIYTHA